MYEREMRNENSICLSKAGKNVRTGNAERKQHLPEQSRKECTNGKCGTKTAFA